MSYKHIRKFLYVFLPCVMFLLTCTPLSVNAATSHKNAYLNCYFDEATCSYKYKVTVSGQELEYSRVASLFPEGYLNRKKKSTKWYLYNLSVLNSEDNKRELVSRVKVEDTGYVSVSASKDGKKVKDFTSVKNVGDKDCLPLTFPALNGDPYTEADRVRCEEVADTLGGDFNEALTFINDDNIYTDIDYFHKMVLALIATDNGGVLTNGFGTSYKIEWGTSTSGNGYLKTVTITDVTNSNTKTIGNTYVYAMKKGYKGCSLGEVMENGQKNNIAFEGDEYKDVVDTTWITWEHLYLNAEILYCEGVTASNIEDVHEESSIVTAIKSLLNATLTSVFKDLTMNDALDRVFNMGLYGSDLYVYGIYKNNVNDTVFTIYLAFFAIVVSLISVSVIRLINEHQHTAVYNSMSRANILKDAKTLITVLLIIGFSWQIYKVLFMLNYYFVEIWKGFLAENYNIAGLYHNVFALNWVLDIALIIIAIYIEIMYILRSIFVPILIACSPLFIYLYTLGGNFQRITVAWFKELLGTIFLQSIHAFTLTFVMIIVQSSSGIVQVVVWACIIPITKMFRDMCGLGGKELFQAAKGLSSSAGSAIGSGIGAAGSAIGAGAGAIGGVAGGTLGTAVDSLTASAGLNTNFSDKISNIGVSTGQALGKTVGAVGKAETGLGMLVASGGEDGIGLINSGINDVSGAVSQVGNTMGKAAGGLYKPKANRDALRTRNENLVNQTRASINGSYSGPNGLTGTFGANGSLTASYTPPAFLDGCCELSSDLNSNGVTGKVMADFNMGMTQEQLASFDKGRRYQDIPNDKEHALEKRAAAMKAISTFSNLSKHPESLKGAQADKAIATYNAVCKDFNAGNLSVVDRPIKVTRTGAGNNTSEVERRGVFIHAERNVTKN